MNGTPAVIVNKGGFLSALAKGLFGTIMVVVICGTALGLYGLRMADKHAELVVGEAVSTVQELLKVLPDWQKAMPPSVKDALNDRRAPEYRDQLDVSARLAKVNGRPVVVVEVVNNGTEIVSLLPLRVVIEDAGGTPLREMSVYAATPLLICDEWPGPMLPGAGPRKVTQNVCCPNGAAKVTFEITDLRVARNAPAEPEVIAAPDTAETPAESAAVATAGD